MTPLIKPAFNTSVIAANIKKNTHGKADEEELKKVCMEFEALLINQMLSTMRKSIPKGGLIENKFGEDTFREMLDQEYAKDFAMNDQRGLAKTLFDQLTKENVATMDKK